MKAKHTFHKQSVHYCPAYPNEADTSYYMQKLLNIITGLCCAVGLAAAVVFLSALA